MLLGPSEKERNHRKQILWEAGGDGAERTNAGTVLRWERSFTLGKDSEHRNRAGGRRMPPFSTNGKQGSELTGWEIPGMGPESPPPLVPATPWSTCLQEATQPLRASVSSCVTGGED